MQQAADMVRQMPGCSILPVARAIGPNGSTCYGYASVHRAIRAGLIKATRNKGRYVLQPA